jgi:gliding motility-associated-like protein
MRPFPRSFPSLPLVLLLFFFGNVYALAQEDCANGVDDDGDGLVDINDVTDCSCNFAPTVPSFLPNASLEDFDSEQAGCRSRQPGGLPDAPNQANCLVGWQRASFGTTDSWNAFTLPGAPPFFPASLPQPLPSGTGVAGFWVGVVDGDDPTRTNGDGSTTEIYREYLAACLADGNTLQSGQNYRLTFSLGFMQPQEFESTEGQVVNLASPAPIELAVYGIQNCGQVYFGDFFGCPEEAGAVGWVRLGTVRVDGQAGRWTSASLDFTSPGTFQAFAIGGSCAADIGRSDSPYYRNYYFIDDVLLNRPRAFEQPVAGPVAVEGQTICADRIRLIGTVTPGADYQWYKNGAAIIGETASTLSLEPSPAIDGAYVLRVTTAGGCALSEEVIVQRPVLFDQIPDSVQLCQVGDTVVLSPRFNSFATYEWSDGSTRSFFQVAQPGEYSVTVSSACEQRVERFVVTADDQLTFTTVVDPAEPCEGDTVSLSINSNWFIPFFAFADTNNEFLPQDDRGNYLAVAGETDTILINVFTSCELLVDTLVIAELDPFVVTADIEPLSCENPVGGIALTVNDLTAVDFEWRDQTGTLLPDDGPQLTVRVAGTYTVTLADGVRCPTTLAYEVPFDDDFAVSLETTEAFCGGDGTAQAIVAGGVPPYRASWFRSTTGERLSGDSLFFSGLDTGAYRLEVEDATGCILPTFFTITAPPPLTVTAQVSFADCTDPTSGILTAGASGGSPPYRFRLNDGEDRPGGVFSGLSGGSYTLTATDNQGCGSPPIEVTIEPPRTFSIELGEDRILALGDSLTLQLGVTGVPDDFGTVRWTPPAGLGFPFGDSATIVTARPLLTTRYTATFTSLEGCSLQDDVEIVVDATPRVYVPTAFSPDGDGNNDQLFAFPGPGIAAILTFEVYDRWGSLLWSMTEEEFGWDGRLGGRPVPTGVYAYVLTYRTVDNREGRSAGTVVVVGK